MLSVCVYTRVTTYTNTSSCGKPCLSFTELLPSITAHLLKISICLLTLYTYEYREIVLSVSCMEGTKRCDDGDVHGKRKGERECV